MLPVLQEEQRSRARELLTTLRQQADAAAHDSSSGDEAASEAGELSERLQRLRELRRRLSPSIPASA